MAAEVSNMNSMENLASTSAITSLQGIQPLSAQNFFNLTYTPENQALVSSVSYIPGDPVAAMNRTHFQLQQILNRIIITRTLNAKNSLILSGAIPIEYNETDIFHMEVIRFSVNNAKELPPYGTPYYSNYTKALGVFTSSWIGAAFTTEMTGMFKPGAGELIQAAIEDCKQQILRRMNNEALHTLVVMNGKHSLVDMSNYSDEFTTYVDLQPTDMVLREEFQLWNCVRKKFGIETLINRADTLFQDTQSDIANSPTVLVAPKEAINLINNQGYRAKYSHYGPRAIKSRENASDKLDVPGFTIDLLVPIPSLSTPAPGGRTPRGGANYLMSQSFIGETNWWLDPDGKHLSTIHLWDFAHSRYAPIRAADVLSKLEVWDATGKFNPAINYGSLQSDCGLFYKAVNNKQQGAGSILPVSYFGELGAQFMNNEYESDMFRCLLKDFSSGTVGSINAAFSFISDYNRKVRERTPSQAEFDRVLKYYRSNNVITKKSTVPANKIFPINYDIAKQIASSSPSDYMFKYFDFDGARRYTQAAMREFMELAMRRFLTAKIIMLAVQQSQNEMVQQFLADGNFRILYDNLENAARRDIDRHMEQIDLGNTDFNRNYDMYFNELESCADEIRRFLTTGVSDMVFNDGDVYYTTLVYENDHYVVKPVDTVNCAWDSDLKERVVEAYKLFNQSFNSINVIFINNPILSENNDTPREDGERSGQSAAWYAAFVLDAMPLHRKIIGGPAAEAHLTNHTPRVYEYLREKFSSSKLVEIIHQKINANARLRHSDSADAVAAWYFAIALAQLEKVWNQRTGRHFDAATLPSSLRGFLSQIETYATPVTPITRPGAADIDIRFKDTTLFATLKDTMKKVVAEINIPGFEFDMAELIADIKQVKDIVSLVNSKTQTAERHYASLVSTPLMCYETSLRLNSDNYEVVMPESSQQNLVSYNLPFNHRFTPKKQATQADYASVVSGYGDATYQVNGQQKREPIGHFFKFASGMYTSKTLVERVHEVFTEKSRIIDLYGFLRLVLYFQPFTKQTLLHFLSHNVVIPLTLGSIRLAMNFVVGNIVVFKSDKRVMKTTVGRMFIAEGTAVNTLQYNMTMRLQTKTHVMLPEFVRIFNGAYVHSHTGGGGVQFVPRERVSKWANFTRNEGLVPVLIGYKEKPPQLMSIRGQFRSDSGMRSRVSSHRIKTDALDNNNNKISTYDLFNALYSFSENSTSDPLGMSHQLPFMYPQGAYRYTDVSGRVTLVESSGHNPNPADVFAPLGSSIK